MSSSVATSEKDVGFFKENVIQSGKVLHHETILEDVTAETFAREVQLIDESKAREIEEELAKSRQSGYMPVTPEEWKAHRALNWMFDLFVIPFCTLTYLFCGLDRSNIGNAATDDFTQDLGMPADSVNTATSLFIATYVPFMPITTGLGRRMGQANFLGFAGLCWGILTLAQAFIKTQGQLIAVRLLIGLAESGFYATATSYISIFYPRFNLAFRISLFFFAYAVAGGFGGLIAYGAFTINGSLWGWQYLFIIEGVCSIALAVATPFWLPKSPGTAWFLTKSERAYAEKRMIMDSAENLAASNSLSKRDIMETLKDWKLWITIPCSVLTTMGPTGFSTFLPVVVKGLGYSANLMSVPPYVAGSVVVLIFCYSSDRFHERSIHVLVGIVIVIIGLILTITLPLENVNARYGGLIVLLSGTFVATPLVTAWLAGNTPDPGKRTLVLSLNNWGNLGQIISSELFQSQYAPNYQFSLKVLLALMVVAFFGYSCVHITLRLANRWKAKKAAAMTPQERQDENLTDKRVGDKKLTFVYGL